MTSRYGRAGFTITMSAPSSTSSWASLTASRAPRVHLVAAAIPELRRRLGRLAERPVESRGVFRRIGEDRHLLEIRPVERLADGRHPPVHHVGRGDDIGARPRLRHRGLRQQLERRVVENLVTLHDDQTLELLAKTAV